MQRRSRFISDVAQVASGAASALGGLREEIDNLVRQRIERALNRKGLVTREEFDALQTRHEAVAARLAALEAADREPANDKTSGGAKPKKAAKTARASRNASPGAGTGDSPEGKVAGKRADAGKKGN